MGMMDRFIGVAPTVDSISNAAGNVAEIFHENATRRMELDEEAYGHAITQLTAEFGARRRGWFDDFVNGLNRLPRPLMTLGTIGLFVYAMVAPVAFSARMEGLAMVPEPLWWLLGAIVSFYFGAREAHYFRGSVFPRRIVGKAAPLAATTGSDVAGREEPAPTAAEIAQGEASLQQALAAAIPVPNVAASDTAPDPARFPDNAALRDWARTQKARKNSG